LCRIVDMFAAQPASLTALLSRALRVRMSNR
jgi:hypothetical protein